MGCLRVRVGAVLLAVGVLCGGWLLLTAAGSSAASSGVHRRTFESRVAGPVGARQFSPSVSELGASALRTPGAMRSRVPAAAGARLSWLSRADSDTFEAGSGRLESRIYPTPVNYRTASGSFAAINPALTASGGGYVQTANDLGVELPKNGATLARVSVARGSVAFGLVGASGVRHESGTTDAFSDALPGVDLAYGSEDGGVAWQASMTAVAAAHGLRWRVSPSRGLTAKLVSGGVAFVDAAGKTVWVFSAPTARAAGSTTPVAVRLSLTRSGSGDVITATAMAAKASGARSEFSGFDPVTDAPAVADVALVNSNPIVWDGQIVADSYAYVGPAWQTGDCYIDSGTPTTSLCGGATDYVGPDDHMLVNFDVADALPTNVQVLGADLITVMSSESSSTDEQVGVWQAADPWTDLASWDSYDGSNNWTTPGGDTTGAMESEYDVGGSGAVGGDDFWDVTSSVRQWVDGSSAEDGLILEPVAGTSAPTTFGFGTLADQDTDGSQPFIEVFYQPRAGDYPNARYDSQQLTDRSSEGVNVATGNLLVSNTDLNLEGVNGLDVNVGRYYNNLSSSQVAFGVGWTMGTGADTYLTVQTDGENQVDYFDGTGDGEAFAINSSGVATAPPGEDAQLTMNADNTYTASTFTLLFRHSGITETFTAPANATGKVAQLTSLTDRNGNTISYHYNSSEQLTSIVDSYGNTTTIDWSPEGYIDEITDPTGREYRYFQNSSGQLTEYEDPAGNDTYYSYDSYGNLTQIQTPAGNITNFTYDAGNTNEVESVERLVDPTDSTGPTTTYQLGAASSTCTSMALTGTNTAGWSQDTVSDPNRHTTTYCTDAMDRLVGVVDAAGHTQSTSYDADGYVSSTTSALGATPSTFTYSTDGDDNVTDIQQGTTGGGGSGGGAYGSALSTQMSYTGTAGTANQYLPSSMTDAAGNTTSYEYGNGTTVNGAGEPTQIQDGLSSHNTATLTYNTNGTLATSTDANGNETTYGYTSGNLTSIDPPSGSGLHAETLTYDSANRVASISTVAGSPATGHKVSYSYNDLDQITQAVYKNAAGSTVATITYTYDPDGNLTEMQDGSGSTYYDYDGLNRLTNVIPSVGGDTYYTYNAGSNLTSIYDASGTTNYTYNSVNQVTAVTDPSSTHSIATMTYDADGNPLAITYPSGASVVNTYNDLDQRTKTTDAYKTSAGAAAHLSYTYAYTNGLEHTVTDQSNNVTTYSYDALDRLTEAETLPSGSSSPTSEYQYTLDGNGNLIKEITSGSAVTANTTSYAYNSGNEACWSYSGTTSDGCSTTPSGGHDYTYDTDGDQTSNGNGLTATYNALDQTTSITSGGTTTDYGYIGEGQGLLTSDGSNTLTNSTLGVDATTNASNTTYYTRNTNGQLLDQRPPSGNVYDYLYDGNGNVVGLTDSNAHLVNQYTYTPTGTQTAVTSTIANPFGYNAGYTLESGLDHYGARYYNPSQGSWTQEDPLDQITDLTQDDRFVYAGADPINFADPLGESIFSDIYDTVKSGVDDAADGLDSVVGKIDQYLRDGYGGTSQYEACVQAIINSLHSGKPSLASLTQALISCAASSS
jgi:RHS repeat-associated protein